jgi:hypothetical protein
MGELEQLLLNTHVVLMAIAAWVILWALRKVWSGFDKIGIVRKLKPLYAAALCEGFVWIPGVLPEATLGERILIAVWAGFLSSIGYQLLQRFVQQKVGVALPENPDELEPGGAPEEEPEEEKGDEEKADEPEEEKKDDDEDGK